MATYLLKKTGTWPEAKSESRGSGRQWLARPPIASLCISLHSLGWGWRGGGGGGEPNPKTSQGRKPFPSISPRMPKRLSTSRCPMSAKLGEARRSSEKLGEARRSSEKLKRQFLCVCGCACVRARARVFCPCAGLLAEDSLAASRSVGFWQTSTAATVDIYGCPTLLSDALMVSTAWRFASSWSQRARTAVSIKTMECHTTLTKTS